MTFNSLCLDQSFCLVFAPDAWLAVVGTILALAGGILTIYGTRTNCIHHNYRKAMRIWRGSNIILVVWAFGNLMAWWDGALAISAVMGMYLVLFYYNEVGLRKRDDTTELRRLT